MSDTALERTTFYIIDDHSRIAFRGSLPRNAGAYGNFQYHYFADFSSLTESGAYRLQVLDQTTQVFKIGVEISNSLPDSLLRFLRVQRCGDSEALHHKACHLKDATQLIGDLGYKGAIDLTGGWHDAGDYTKFTLTTAYTCYLLALCYELNPGVFHDFDRDGRIDILEELKFGLEWLIKAHYGKNRLATQVQDTTDHTVGWRLPENDPLASVRPAFNRATKAHFGSASAALALGSAVFYSTGDKVFAKKCCQQSEQLYDEAAVASPAGAHNGENHYYDPTDRDNLALAAVELYFLTADERYFTEAKSHIDSAKGGHWISWGDMGGIVDARLSSLYPPSRERLEKMLSYYDSLSASNPFGYPLESFPWGSLAQQMGVGALALMFERSFQSARFHWLALKQGDFALGCNPHGVSFIAGFGWNYTRNFHHQVAFLKSIVLPGGVAEGYIERGVFEKAGVILSTEDRFARFQWNDAVYHDDRNDFLCNEPTIYLTAQTIFYFTLLSSLK